MITINTHISTSLGGIETLIRELQIQYLGSERKIKELFKYDGADEVYQKSTSVDYIEYGFYKGNSVFKVVSALNLKNALRKQKPVGEDVFLFHPTDLLYIPVSVLDNNNVIMVQTNRFDIIFTKFGKLAMSLRGKYIKHFTVYTAYDREHLAQLYPELSNKISIIPRGCKIEKAHNIPPISKKILMVCRIEEKQKNFKAAVEVFKHLPDDYRLDIYGTGDAVEIAELTKLISSDSRISYKGATDKVEEVYRQYSLFLMTSKYEGFGQTLIEARSQGLPIVLFDTFPAAKWIVRNSENGYLISPYNTQDMALKIRTILESPEIYHAFCHGALLLADETTKHTVNERWKELRVE
ncbi:glycosyltransferase [Shewanella sp.]|uniref:glycosyltransferase n=1 Tax=Shewanella sp. TaxID=50422 RepID=UPI003A968CC6